MNYPIILMMHNICGRVRLKISHPIIDIKEADKFLKETPGIKDVRYNEHIKSIVIEYNHMITNVENVIFKLALFISTTYGFSQIKFISNTRKQDMPLLSYYSLISILGANIANWLNPAGSANEIINWVATGSTVGAIFEHGYEEMQERGSIDPEVMSIMYLINAIGKGNMVSASLISWVMTFGRHILKTSHESFIIKVRAKNPPCSKEKCYDISVVPADVHSKRIDTFKMFASEILQSQNKSINNSLNQKTINFKREVFCN